VIEAGTKERVRQTCSACDGLRALTRPAQTVFPVKRPIGRFECGRDVDEPYRAPRAVAHEVDAQVPQLILRSGHARAYAAHRRDARTTEHIVESSIGQIGESGVEVDRERPVREAGQGNLRGGTFVGPHEQVDVAAVTKPGFRIKARSDPALGQEWFDTGRLA